MKNLVLKSLVNKEKNAKVNFYVIKIVSILLKKSYHMFHEFFKEMEDDGHLVYLFEIRWLSCEKVKEKVWKLQDELWFNGQEDNIEFSYFKNHFGLLRAYLFGILFSSILL